MLLKTNMGGRLWEERRERKNKIENIYKDILTNAKKWVRLKTVMADNVRHHSSIKDTADIDDMYGEEFSHARKLAGEEFFQLDMGFLPNEIKI